MKPTRTLVLIANEKEAKILVNSGPGKGLEAVSHFDRAGDTEYADRKGREQSAPGMARHGMEPSTSLRAQNRDAFAAEVLKAVRQEWGTGGHDRFVMSAPPSMLGALRGQLCGALSQALVADLNKDLLGVAVTDLPRHFEDVIVF